MEIVYIILIAFSVLVFIGVTISGAATASIKKLIKTNETGSTTLSRTASEFCKDILIDKKINVQVARIPGNSYAAYDYRNKVVALSDDIYSSYSAVSVAMATHEVGHAIQDDTDTAKFRIYKKFNLGSKILTPIFWLSFLVGIILLFAIPYDFIPAYVAFGVMGGSVLIEIIFKLSTVSMEKQASEFALDILQKEGFSDEELKLASHLYKAALTTYIAGIFDPVVKIFNAITWLIYNSIGRLFR